MREAIKDSVKKLLKMYGCSVKDKEVWAEGYNLGAWVYKERARLDVVAECGDKVVVVEVERALAPLLTIDDTATQWIVHRITAAALTLKAHALFILTPSVDAYRDQVNVAREVVKKVSGKDMDMKVFIVKNIEEFEKELKQFLGIESPEIKHAVIGIDKYIKSVKTEPRKGPVKRFDRRITERLQKL